MTDTGPDTDPAGPSARRQELSIIWFTQASLSNVLRLETYINDAERAGEDEFSDPRTQWPRRAARSRLPCSLPSPYALRKNSFEVVAAGERHVFDSFEFAIHLMAPVCQHCGCRVLGHGGEGDGRCFSFCARCARDAPAPPRHGTESTA